MLIFIVHFKNRLIDATNLATKKVDEAAYEKVKGKLAKLVEDKPPPEKAKQQMEGYFFSIFLLDYFLL